MPPASPDTTLAWRSASSSEVLPWSTWPITVTTGDRGSVSVESSTVSNMPSSTSAAATRLTERAARAATDLARTFVLVGDVGGDAGRPRNGHRTSRGGGARFGFAKSLLGFELGLALGLFVLAVALFFGLAAGFGGLALSLLDAFPAFSAPCFPFPPTPLFLVTHFCARLTPCPPGCPAPPPRSPAPP